MRNRAKKNSNCVANFIGMIICVFALNLLFFGFLCATEKERAEKDNYDIDYGQLRLISMWIFIFSSVASIFGFMVGKNEKDKTQNHAMESVKQLRKDKKLLKNKVEKFTTTTKTLLKKLDTSAKKNQALNKDLEKSKNKNMQLKENIKAQEERLNNRVETLRDGLGDIHKTLLKSAKKITSIEKNIGMRQANKEDIIKMRKISKQPDKSPKRSNIPFFKVLDTSHKNIKKCGKIEMLSESNSVRLDQVNRYIKNK